MEDIVKTRTIVKSQFLPFSSVVARPELENRDCQRSRADEPTAGKIFLVSIVGCDLEVTDPGAEAHRGRKALAKVAMGTNWPVHKAAARWNSAEEGAM